MEHFIDCCIDRDQFKARANQISIALVRGHTHDKDVGCVACYVCVFTFGASGCYSSLCLVSQSVKSRSEIKHHHVTRAVLYIQIYNISIPSSDILRVEPSVTIQCWALDCIKGGECTIEYVKIDTGHERIGNNNIKLVSQLSGQQQTSRGCSVLVVESRTIIH